MNKTILAALALIATASFSSFASADDLSAKAMKDAPGVSK